MRRSSSEQAPLGDTAEQPHTDRHPVGMGTHWNEVEGWPWPGAPQHSHVARQYWPGAQVSVPHGTEPMPQVNANDMHERLRVELGLPFDCRPLPSPEARAP